MSQVRTDTSTCSMQGIREGGFLRAFRCLRLRIELQATSTVQLPAYRGSTVRGALGMALKKSCCSARQLLCADCVLRYSCLYVYLFETPLAAGSPGNARYRFAPHPFVLQLGIDTGEVLRVGEKWSFAMTLIGRAIEFTPYLVVTLQRMAEEGLGKERGGLRLQRVTTLDANGAIGGVLYENGILAMPRDSLEVGAANGEAARKRSRSKNFRLRFLTPTRLVYQGELSQKPEFHVLVGNLVRRLENLDHFHCDGNGGAPIDRVIENARQVHLVEDATTWYDWERYSHRQNRKMRLGGIVGEAVYEGDPDSFEPFLSLGAWVNVGKGTSFGLGRYLLVR